MLRALTGTVWVTFKLKLDDPWIQAMMQAGGKYDLEVKEVGPKHELGAPHTHKYIALVDCMCQDQRLSDKQRRLVAAHKVQKIDHEDLTYAQLAEICLHLKVKKVYRKDEAEQQTAIVSFAVAAAAEVHAVDEGGGALVEDVQELIIAAFRMS